jgi:hypothetical protein
LKLRVLYARMRAVDLLVGQAVNLLNAGYLTSMCRIYTSYVNLCNLTTASLDNPGPVTRTCVDSEIIGTALLLVPACAQRRIRLSQFVDMTYCHNTEVTLWKPDFGGYGFILG